MHPKKIKTTTVVFEESFANLSGLVSKNTKNINETANRRPDPSSSDEEPSENRQRLDTSSEDQNNSSEQSDHEKNKESTKDKNKEDQEFAKEDSSEESDALFERKEQINRKKETLAEQTIRENVQKVFLKA